MGKESTCKCRRHMRGRFESWVRKIPWRRKRQPTPVFLPGESPCTEDPGVIQSMEIQRSFDGWSCVPSLLFIWGQTMVEIMKIMAASFKRSQACTATLSAPNPAAGHHQPLPPLETPGHSRASLGQSLVGSLLLS